MNLKLVVRPSAIRDIADAYDWYERRQAGLGGQFLDAVEAIFELIAARSRGYPVVVRDVRRALVARFPYSVYFRVRGGEIRVLAVIHQHRDPKTWKRRVEAG